MAVTYREAGVDIDAAEGWLARMRPLIRSTWGPGVLPDRGQFAGLFRLGAARCRDPVLVLSTDGVGTKLKIAQLAQPHGGAPARVHERRRGAAKSPSAHEVIGVDVVAMNTNDVLVYGAKPLAFLDYLAIGRMQPDVMSGLLRGIADGCRQSGCALLGGETAEMPGVYASGEYDVAGFCVGLVERARLIDGSRVRAGDLIVGLASSGLHANGFSLVRRVFTTAQLRRLAPQLLVPSRIYVRPILEVLRGVSLHSVVHVTGGGLARRIPNLVAKRPELRTRLQPASWPVPPMFQTIQRAGRIAMDEMTATFNMGIGMALACRAVDVGRVVQILQRWRVAAWPIGTIERV